MTELLNDTFDIFNYVAYSDVSIYCIGLLSAVIVVKLFNRLARR